MVELKCFSKREVIPVENYVTILNLEVKDPKFWDLQLIIFMAIK